MGGRLAGRGQEFGERCFLRRDDGASVREREWRGRVCGSASSTAPNASSGTEPVFGCDDEDVDAVGGECDRASLPRCMLFRSGVLACMRHRAASIADRGDFAEVFGVFGCECEAAAA